MSTRRAKENKPGTDRRDRADETDDALAEPQHRYYYDDATGYEVFEDTNDQEDDDESSPSSS